MGEEDRRWSGLVVYEEPEAFELVKKIVKLGDIVVDIGAHSHDGADYTTLLSGLVGREGYVHAFDPRGIDAPDAPNINKLNYAVWSYTGTIKMQHDRQSDMMFISGSQIDVPAVSLDDFFSKEAPIPNKPSFIKIDAEGAEWPILLGGKRLLTDSKDLKILLEYHYFYINSYGATGVAIWHLIDDMGYNIYDLETKKKLDIDEFTSFNRKNTPQLLLTKGEWSF